MKHLISSVLAGLWLSAPALALPVSVTYSGIFDDAYANYSGLVYPNAVVGDSYSMTLSFDTSTWWESSHSSQASYSQRAYGGFANWSATLGSYSISGMSRSAIYLTNAFAGSGYADSINFLTYESTGPFAGAPLQMYSYNYTPNAIHSDTWAALSELSNFGNHYAFATQYYLVNGINYSANLSDNNAATSVVVPEPSLVGDFEAL